MLSWRESEHTLFLFHLAAVQQPLSLPEGEITTIEIHRSNPYIQLGISIVGGNETPLINIVIQEVYRDGVIARDGRLLAGDQILQVTLTTLLVCSFLFYNLDNCDGIEPGLYKSWFCWID